MIDFVNDLNKSLLLQNNRWKDLSLSLNSSINNQLFKVQKDLSDSINNNFYKNILGISHYEEFFKKQKSLFNDTILSKVSGVTGINMITKNYKDTVDKISQSFKTENIISQIAPFNDILKYTNKYVSGLSKSLNIQNSLFDNNLIKMNFSMYAEVSQFNKIFNNNSIVERIRDELESINYSELDFYKDDLKKTYNIDFEEIREEIKEDLNNLEDDLISYIDKKIVTKKESKITNVIKYILLNILINGFIVGYFVNITSPDLREIIKNISINDKQINKQILNEIIEYRYVDTDCLNVRLCDTSKSKIVGKLYKSEIVMVCKISGDWILIERIENNVIIKGWVYRRYVKKF